MVLLGSATLPGTRYGSLNQDYVLTDVLFTAQEIENLKCPQMYIAIVLDGHGMLGELAAQRAGNSIMKHLKTSSKLRERALDTHTLRNIERIFTDAFHAAHAVVLDSYSEAPNVYTYPLSHTEERRYSLGKLLGHQVYRHPLTGPRLVEFGTTATAVLIQSSTLAIAHVGDTQVILGYETSKYGYDAIFLTDKHSCQHPEERKRVRDLCGEKVKIKEEDGYLQVPCLPGTNTSFSLAMTRAIGHKLMETYGVVPTPEVMVRRLKSTDVCVIVGSDGVWEGLTAKESVAEIADSMSKGITADAAAHALCSSAVDAVKAYFKQSMPDNTTAAVIVFDEVTELADVEGGEEMGIFEKE